MTLNTQPCLRQFVPRKANRELVSSDLRPIDSNSVIITGFDAMTEQCLWRALKNSGQDKFSWLDPNEDFIGQRWYDAIPRLTNIEFKVYQGDGTIPLLLEAIQEDTQVDRIELHLTLQHPTSSTVETLVLPAPIYLHCDNGLDCLSEVAILLAKDHPFEVLTLCDLLEAALFEPYSDVEAGNYYTQQQVFNEEATLRAEDLLFSREQLNFERLIETSRNHLCRLVAEDTVALLRVSRNKVTVRLVPSTAT